MRRSLLVLTLAVAAVAACGDNKHGTQQPTTDGGTDGGTAPVGPVGGGSNPDEPKPVEMACATLPATTNTCDVTAGDVGNTKILLKGNVLTPTNIYKGGQVLIGGDGKIQCVGCDCTADAAGATTLSCPDASISPGLVNIHDHITYDQNVPYTDTGERYEDRQQWREGLDSHTKIPAAGSATNDQISWAELRFMMGGATSISGSGGQNGLLRNLDKDDPMQGGLKKQPVDFDTFPLDDADGTRSTENCDYGTGAMTSFGVAALAKRGSVYEPHTSEGIDATAHNEFLCQSSRAYDTTAPGTSQLLMQSQTAMIHAIGLNELDYAAMSAAKTSLVWSPRSNITLYGDTARVSAASRLGVNVALGTDWMPTGSMNLLRELTCADSFNQKYLGKFFRDDQLWRMVTINAAKAVHMDDAIGVLDTGRVADVSIFAAHGKDPYRAVIESQPQDVALVMRGGKVLYGDATTLTALAAPTCDTVDVCGVSKQVCVATEVTGKTYDLLKATSKYPAFACGTPDNEPSCSPKRPTAVANSTVYTGETSDSDKDGDGIPDAVDNCPDVFNPIRPMDGGKQADFDGDNVGDACDPCPLDYGTGTCKPVDRDGDKFVDVLDNCPDVANADQKDSDGDGTGDACDVCPADSNPNLSGCPTTIYKINNGTTPVGRYVKIENALVTAISNAASSNGFFVQTKLGDAGYDGVENSGLFIFTSSKPDKDVNGVAIKVGNRVTVEGNLQNFFTQLEISGNPVVTVTSTTVEELPLPAVVSYADIKTGGPKALAYDGVLVTVGPGSVASVNTTLKDFLLSDGTTSIIVDGFVSPLTLPAVGQGYTSVTGILVLKGEKIGTVTTTESKIEPRGPSDLATVLGVLSLGPAGQYARVAAPAAAAPTFPLPLAVTLSGPAPTGGTVVTLTSDDTTSLTVDATITVAAGSNTAIIPVTALKAAADVKLTAAVTGANSQTAHVRVLDTNEGPTKLTLSPKTSTIASGGEVTFTAVLDLPALTAQVLTLTVDVVAAGTFTPATITIGEGQTTGTFKYTDVAADSTATATITAACTAGTDTATVTVSSTSAIDHLIINEVDYDQSVNPDSTEYVEIYNPTSAPIALAGKALVLVNGATAPNGVVYGTPATIDLSGAIAKGGAAITELPSHGYLLIAGKKLVDTLPNGTLVLQTAWVNDAVQNGGAAATSASPDGIALIDTTAHALIDALSYEGAITTVTLPNFTAPSTLVQSDTPAPATIFDPGDGSLCRSPDGGAYKVCTTGTPGAAN